MERRNMLVNGYWYQLTVTKSAVADLVDELTLFRSPFGLPVYVTACQSVPFSLDLRVCKLTIAAPKARPTLLGR